MFSQVHWYYNNDITSKLYCTYRNHAAIPKKKTKTSKQNKTKLSKKIKQNKRKQKNKTKQNKKNKTQKTTTQQTKTATTHNSPCLHHRWKCYQEIALNDE